MYVQSLPFIAKGTKVLCKLSKILCKLSVAFRMSSHKVLLNLHIELFDKFDKIPTATEIMNIMVMDPKEIEKDSTKKAILNWYFDRWLPVAAGSMFWGTNIRYYHLPVDKEAVIPGEQNKKVWVTVSSEAFGFLVLENCHVSTQEF